jgi:ADP-heptose:LPS heptosyltransferase
MSEAPAARHIVPDVRKIAVLRANAIGDFVLALPALAALRAAYRQAEIVLLGLPWHAGFLHGRPGPVDRVIAIPPVPGVRDGEADRVAVDAFFRSMEEERFDLAIQLHGGGRHSNPFVKRLGARLSVGLQAADAQPLDRCIPHTYFQPEIVRYLEVVALAGAPPLDLDPRLAVTAGDREEAARVVPRSDAPLALLHPGASDPRRRWPVSHFTQVGNALRDAGAHVLVNGTGAELELCSALSRSVPGSVNICGLLSLGGLLGVLARCAVVVSNDTGPLHLAAAVGTRTVGIYWCFNLVNSSQLTRMLHRPFVSWTTHCPACARNCTDGRCAHEVSFVASVPVDAVRDAALEHLWRSTAPRRGSQPSALFPSCTPLLPPGASLGVP